MLSNIDIAELLAQQAERETGILSRAFRRAARSAFLWPEEISDLVEQNRALNELRSVGPFIEKQIQNWIGKPPRRAKTVPAIRQDFISLAEARRLLAKRPAWSKKLRGDLQMHSRWSDGSGTIAQMADAAKERSYEYLAITDHSKGLKIAGGIDERALKAQGAEITKVNIAIQKSGVDLTVLRSIEMNLNPRGEGDMSPESLLDLDLVLGSFHSSLRTTENQTERYLQALRNPQVHILGHPRGRIYNFRIGLTAYWPRVFAEAARLDKAVEIDCYPDRQDLNVELLKLAREHGTRISLGTDAHHPWQLEFIDLGLAAALRAGIPEDRILNFMPLSELRAWAQRVRDRHAADATAPSRSPATEAMPECQSIHHPALPRLERPSSQETIPACIARNYAWRGSLCQIVRAARLTVISTAPRCRLLFLFPLGHCLPSRCIAPAGE